jgi:hypothetical protein
MAKELILKSASFEAGGDEAREGNLEQVMENAGYDVVEPEAPGSEGDSAALAGQQPPPRKVSRRERAIEKATAPLRERIAQLEAGQPQRAVQAEAVPNLSARPKPQRVDFASNESYEDALLTWGTQKALNEKALQDAQAAQRQHLERNLQHYAAQVKEAKGRYEDWDEVVGQDIYIGKEVQLAILENRENAAQVIYYLGRNPSYAAKLGEMSPLSAVMEVGRLSARLKTGAAGGEARPRPRPRVPAPVRTVSTAGTAESPTFAEIAARPNYAGKAKDLKRAMER